MTDTPLCGVHDCTRTAVLTVRMRPYRTDAPVSAAVRRALGWPGGIANVPVCGRHVHEVRKAGLVLSEVVIGDAVETRTVEE